MYRLLLSSCVVSLVAVASCRKEAPRPGSPPKVEAYVWQDSGRPAVAAAMARAKGIVETLHIRAAELRWTGRGFTIERRVKDALPVPEAGLVVRIGASASKLEWTPEQIAPVATVFRELAALKPREIQCDYDCPQKRLDRYAVLLDALGKAAGDIPVVPTTLPSWLGEPAFRKLIASRPSWVLQVHSLQLPKRPEDPVRVFDPAEARSAVSRAAALGVPFRVAMATYGCEVWFDETGKVSEVISEDGPPPDGRQPASRAFSLADPGESAALIREWNASPPAGLTAVIWYRLPVEGDRRNWPWVTFERVIQGGEDSPDLVIEQIGGDQVRDLFVANRGAFPVPLPAEFVIPSDLAAADGTGAYQLERRDDGWHFVRRGGIWPWLDPGKKIPAGWVRTRQPGQPVEWKFRN